MSVDGEPAIPLKRCNFAVMSTSKASNQNRLYIAISLFLLSILAAFAISIIGNTSKSYWVVNKPLAAGVEISASDISSGKALINYGSHHYLSTQTNPVGSFTLRSISAGELLSSQSITRNRRGDVSEEVSLAIRSSDIPMEVEVGDYINVYQVFDSRNGETLLPPSRILSGAFVASIDRERSNFGGDIAVSLFLPQALVPKLLAATSSGRIVLAASHE